jgi:hypothetical protein
MTCSTIHCHQAHCYCAGRIETIGSRRFGKLYRIIYRLGTKSILIVRIEKRGTENLSRLQSTAQGSEVVLTFPNVTPAVFALVLDQLRREGSEIEMASYKPPDEQYTITGHHWPLGDIRANVAFDGATVTVDVVQPKSWESSIGGKIQDAISAAKRAVAGESA